MYDRAVDSVGIVICADIADVVGVTYTTTVFGFGVVNVVGVIVRCVGDVDCACVVGVSVTDAVGVVVVDFDIVVVCGAVCCFFVVCGVAGVFCLCR